MTCRQIKGNIHS